MGGRRARTRSSDRGQILIAAALLISVLLGMAGLIFDFGFLAAQRRQAQNGADAAALAAARIMFEGGTTAGARTAALEYADANGYVTGGPTSVDVAIPPSSGPHSGDLNYVEVTITEQPETFFIGALIPEAFTVRARGVAGFELFPEPYAVVVLSEHDCNAFAQGGDASMVVTGGGVMVNSDCPDEALNKIGSGDLLVDGTIDVHGGADIGGSGTVSPAPRNVPWAVTNPLAGLTRPPRELPPAPGSPGTPNSPVTWQHNSSGDLTLQPGTYYGGFSANCNCTITLLAGTYVMSGGGFTKAGGANLVGNGVTIYVTTNPDHPTGDGRPDPFSLSGSGNLDLSPPGGGPYEGITLWQDAAITDDATMRGSNDLLSGLIYIEGAALDIAGDSELGTVQLVVERFRLSGNAPLNLTYGEFRTFEAPDVVLVE